MEHSFAGNSFPTGILRCLLSFAVLMVLSITIFRESSVTLSQRNLCFNFWFSCSCVCIYYNRKQNPSPENVDFLWFPSGNFPVSVIRYKKAWSFQLVWVKGGVCRISFSDTFRKSQCFMIPKTAERFRQVWQDNSSSESLKAHARESLCSTKTRRR